MNKERIIESERKKLEKLDRLSMLPSTVKRPAILLVLISLITLIAGKLFFEDMVVARQLIKYILLIGMLLIVMAREKEEDEMIISLRGRAFSFAFVAGVVYALMQPLANWIVSIVLNEELSLKELPLIQVLFFMLLVQIAIFHFIKRVR